MLFLPVFSQGYPNIVATYGRGYTGFAPSYSYQFPGKFYLVKRLSALRPPCGCPVAGCPTPAVDRLAPHRARSLLTSAATSPAKLCGRAAPKRDGHLLSSGAGRRFPSLLCALSREEREAPGSRRRLTNGSECYGAAEAPVFNKLSTSRSHAFEAKCFK
ncbi:hypothetical protein Z043_120084 [Scleropages formosus]|uniref:Uncharacterized protein n=1 Tax=Scleropages formosus TaxID=113540 RepID=A0A0P7TVR0_SCLFO|nr:hypothetical protein Z043_120084 [Scleropages formosus]